ncbi:MAG: type II toxin-antitoxin system PrlF family antitoxin [Alphaproteobacteria bacterium]|jgi:antitoxin PrlF|nr:type II toxin-antitoxin system PrlF family antitoxin [Alphaproteobacteria bacterium]
MITSRLASEAKTTIPQPVRDVLHLEEGDEIAYLIEGDRVVLMKAPRREAREDPFKTFGEWDSEADRRAYADL